MKTDAKEMQEQEKKNEDLSDFTHQLEYETLCPKSVADIVFNVFVLLIILVFLVLIYSMLRDSLLR